MATQFDDTINVQRGTVGGAGGDDTLVIAPALVDSNASITISDASGSNTLQFIDGLEISSSTVASDTMTLTLSNGATVTVLEASAFSFEVGGDPLSGTAGTAQTYEAFVTETLGHDAVPTGTDTSEATDAVVIGEAIVSDLPDLPADGGPDPVTEGTAASENITGNQDGATLTGAGADDRFMFDTTEAAVTITDFEAGDQLYFDGFTQADVTLTNTDPTDGTLVLTAGDVSITVENVDEPAVGLIGSVDSFNSVFGDTAIEFA